MTTVRTHHETNTRRGYRPTMQPRGAGRTPVDASCFCGAFSMIDDSPMDLATVPGMTVLVNKGALWVTGAGEGERAYVQAGDRYVSEQVGVLTLTSARRTELSIAVP
jgi:hypothetical protein